MKYQTTKKECQKKIDEIGNVCDSCGRNLQPIRTVDNSHQPTYWAGCLHGGTSGNFTWGVPKGVYRLAYKIVLDDDLYLGMEKEEAFDFDYKFYSAVSKVCRIIKYIERMETKKPRFTKKQLRENFNKYYKIK